MLARRHGRSRLPATTMLTLGALVAVCAACSSGEDGSGETDDLRQAGLCQESTNASDIPPELESLANDLWAEMIRHEPVRALVQGDRSKDAAPMDISEAEFERHFAAIEALRARLPATAPTTPRGMITHAELAKTMANLLEPKHTKRYLWQLATDRDLQTSFAELGSIFHVIRNPTDVDTLVDRYKAAAHLFEQKQQNLLKGVSLGYLPPRTMVDAVKANLDQLARDLATNPAATPFAAVVQPDRLPSEWDEQTKKQALADVVAALTNDLAPALAAYGTFLSDTLRPLGRDSISLLDLPDGDKVYAEILGVYTDRTDRDPNELHERGKSEIEALEQKMLPVALRLVPTALTDANGDPQKALTDVWTKFAADPNEVVTQDHMIEVGSGLVQRAASDLQTVFGKVPSEEMRISGPFFKTDNSGYRDGSLDGARPGVMILAAGTTPMISVMSNLLHHEYTHHLQFSTANVMNLPNAVHPTYTWLIPDPTTAMKEGGATYVETIGRDRACGLASSADGASTGDCRAGSFYLDDRELFGALVDQMRLYVRQVVDTGIHTKGWSAETATNFLVSHQRLAADKAKNSLPRYIGRAAQQMAYAIGARDIREQRDVAMTKLGAKFDEVGFNDVVLRSAFTTIPMFQKLVDRWIEQVQTCSTPAP